MVELRSWTLKLDCVRLLKILAVVVLIGKKAGVVRGQILLFLLVLCYLLAGPDVAWLLVVSKMCFPFVAILSCSCLVLVYPFYRVVPCCCVSIERIVMW